ncbi:Ribosomal protein S7 [Cordyceps fumosorosea ARSEF 2679]|uniref:Ribosomal protein S7 n=1 Tax=Cordyceps fumosorosea (strain ARSEF 2679) TaxID=1081104 RepID=A0A167SCC1_CORFA|nr:Ribosomal protein S7 [Cordyceps fumosorosea ARSEF 2679]OAA59484.1 Ribosomal protein S7 [Cordyceps fumosorosea ARSEF 2679]
MAAAMPRGLRVLQSCRGLAMRSASACARPQGLPQLARHARLQSNDAKSQTLSAISSNAAGAVNSAAEASTPSNPIDSIDDAALAEILYGGRGGAKQAGGLTEAQEEVLYRDGEIPPAESAEAVLAVGDAEVAELEDIHNLGHQWPLPQKPYPDGFNVKKRYHAVVEQITRLMMRDGKLATAQRVRIFRGADVYFYTDVVLYTDGFFAVQNLAMTMNFLRMAPEPTFSPKFPLLPGTPPASHLPLNPILYLTVAIDSVAPLIRVKAISGAGGGGRALDMPQPLTVRQRRRRAFTWILEAVERRPSKGSGRTQFAHRLAEEIVAVVEGRSSVWEKRRLVHKQGTTARANVEKKVVIKKGPSK